MSTGYVVKGKLEGARPAPSRKFLTFWPRTAAKCCCSSFRSSWRKRQRNWECHDGRRGQSWAVGPELGRRTIGASSINGYIAVGGVSRPSLL